MLRLRVSLTEVGDRCGLPLKEVTRLKRAGAGDSEPAPEVAPSDQPLPTSRTLLGDPPVAEAVRA